MNDQPARPTAHVFGVNQVPGIGFQVFEEKGGKRKNLILFQKSDDANEEACRLFSLAELARDAGRNLGRTVDLGPLILQLWDWASDE